MTDFEIAYPETLEQAIDLLDPEDPTVRPFGGGTALMLMMKARLFTPRRLVCLARLGTPLTMIERDRAGACIRIGAMATFSQLEHSPVVGEAFPVVREIMPGLANVRVRNVATVGGSLAHGDPHLDLPPVWAALGAEAAILGPGGRRTVAVEDLFLGYYETAMADGELLTEIRVPVRPGWRSTYCKVTTRAAHDWPALGLALSVAVADRRIDDLRIVLSAAVDRPTRLVEAEAALRGAEVTQAALDRAGDRAAAEAAMETDSRASADYKAHLLRVHLARTVRRLATG